MKNPLVLIACAVVTLLGALPSPAQAQGSELEQLKAQLAALQARVEELERQPERERDKAQVEQAPREGLRAPAEWASRFRWKGDFRYRNETIRQELSAAHRNRDRIRLRAGFEAQVNETLHVEVQGATDEAIGGNGDARSSNVTLTDASSRKRLDLDLAYARWSPTPHWTATFGKMRYPWERASGSLFFDADVNPEGAALAWQQGSEGLFATVFHVQLAERSAGADSTLSGAQFGWRGGLSGGVRYLLAAGYFDQGAVKGYDAVQNADLANAFGNTTTSAPQVCRLGLAACIANDFDIVEVLGELTVQLGGKPLTVVVDYARNTGAEFESPSSPGGLDTAYAAGFQYGRVSGAQSWEFAYLYQKIENDALYGQWVDSDFGGGSTGARGHVLRLGYGFAKGFRVNGAFFWNDTNIEVPVLLDGVPVRDRNYKRFQVDLNMSF